MKKMILAIAATMMLTTAMAQGNNQQGRRNGQRPDRTEMIKMRTDRTVEQYKLNADQAKQLLELNTKYADTMFGGFGGRGGRGGGPRMGGGGFGGGQNGQMPELTEEQKKQFEEMRKQREESQKKYDTELQTILTADQFKAYQEDQAKMRERFGQRGGRRGNRNNQ